MPTLVMPQQRGPGHGQCRPQAVYLRLQQDALRSCQRPATTRWCDCLLVIWLGLGLLLSPRYRGHVSVGFGLVQLSPGGNV